MIVDCKKYSRYCSFQKNRGLTLNLVLALMIEATTHHPLPIQYLTTYRHVIERGRETAELNVDYSVAESRSYKTAIRVKLA